MAFALPRIAPLRNVLVALLLVISLTAAAVATVRPASADTAGQISTRNIILGAVALTAGIILYNNYQHKVAYANSIVGYTADGGVIYGEGRIVYPNGTVVYTSNNGRTICTFDGYGQQCRSYPMYAYYPQGYNPQLAAYRRGVYPWQYVYAHCPPGWAKHGRGGRHHHEDNDQGDHD